MWMFGICLVSVGEVVTLAWNQNVLTYINIAMFVLRVYFVYIVNSLANEIKQYPEGPPVTRVLPATYADYPQQGPATFQQPIIVSSPPVIVPSYGYGYRPYGYGYGGYGYGGDAAILGLGTGLALGGMMGGGYGYGGGFGGGGFYDDGFW
jgi:hypothetical protein